VSYHPQTSLYEIVTGDLSSENSCLVKMVIESMNFSESRKFSAVGYYLETGVRTPKKNIEKSAFSYLSTGIF